MTVSILYSARVLNRSHRLVRKAPDSFSSLTGFRDSTLRLGKSRRHAIRSFSTQKANGKSFADVSYGEAGSVRSYGDEDDPFQRREGLFGFKELLKPEGFDVLTNKAISDADAIKQEIIYTQKPTIRTLKLLDLLSNTLCVVTDTAELVRNVHPDENFRRKAWDTFSRLSDYIQRLNTDVQLYQAIKRACDYEPLMRTLTEEQKRMITLLKQECELNGIHLDSSDRDRAVQLQNETSELGMQFQKNINTSISYIAAPKSSVRSLPPNIYHSLPVDPQDASRVYISTDIHITNIVLKWVRDANVRRSMYMAANRSAMQNLGVLDQLISKRHELADLLGFQSYAHMMTSSRMAGSPEAVESFLQGITQKLNEKAKEDISILAKTKRNTEFTLEGIQAWDVGYYMGILKAREFNLDSRVLASYFPLDRVLKGLGMICTNLFGVDLVKVPMGKGEAWHHEVQKLALIHDSDGVIGYIYLDLYPRAHKYSHAAQFTVRCGRQITAEVYQKPIVALVCNFNRPDSKTSALLSHSELETLFHEFGHALHSLLSKTEFQHTSGTRGQLDFVETPSHLFEYFAWDYDVLDQFARHYDTGERVPKQMITNLRQSKNMFAALETQTQTLYSMLDLKLYGKQPLSGTTTDVLRSLQNEHTQVPFPEGTHWHTRFGHLIGYGAGYYSYLYARVFAAQIWETILASDPLSREAGDKIRQKLLMPGAGKDPTAILESLLGAAPSMDHYLHEIRA